MISPTKVSQTVAYETPDHNEIFIFKLPNLIPTTGTELNGNKTGKDKATKVKNRAQPSSNLSPKFLFSLKSGLILEVAQLFKEKS